MSKVSIRFFDDRKVRAVWDAQSSKWWFSVVDIVGVLRAVDHYDKNRNYWKYLKAKLKNANHQLGSATTQFRFIAPDGKSRMADALDHAGVIELAKNFPSRQANRFIEWFIHSEESIDGRSKSKAYTLFDSTLLEAIEVGTVKGLQQIHSYLFGGLFDFAGQIRSKNISKSGFTFAPWQHFHITLPNIEKMPENTFDEIIDKYVEMNIAHPFMEGNGRSMRIWLDLILKKNLHLCVDWSRIAKNDYLDAMRQSATSAARIKELIENALTDKINDREVYMQGIDYSYYYEQEADYEQET